jgi:mRNA-degrading endonuclease YafQ of YafQ-DinJ toxin-antitoxin module
MEVLFTARFLRSFKKLPLEIQDDCYRAIDIFRKQKDGKKLKLHKLHGKMNGLYSFSANFSFRIVIKKVKGVVHFMDVGSHALYK